MEYEEEWSHVSSAHHRSTYTAARSESPSIYSRRFEHSPRSSFDDFSISRTRPSSESTERNEDPYGSEDETEEPEGESPDTRLGVMGPTTRVYSRAPWELGEDVLPEEDEGRAETGSMLSGRSRFKNPKDKHSSSLVKGLGFASSLAKARSSSVPRPSTDTQGFSSSTSSNYSRPSISSNLRPESPFTSVSHSEYPQGANMVNGYHHHDRSPVPSPRSLQNDRFPTDPEMRRIHPYANPNIHPQTPIYQPHAQHAQVEEGPIALSPSPTGSSGGYNRTASPTGSNYKQGYHPTHGAASPGHHPLSPSSVLVPLASPHEHLPPRMAPWQHTRSSPTFHLLSLEDAQAMKAKQRSAAVGTPSPASSSPHIRGRTVSGNTAQERLKSHTLLQETNEFEDSSKAVTLKTRRSLLGLFAKKEKDRPVTPRPVSPPPPVPSLPPSIPGTPFELTPQLNMPSAPPKSPKRVLPPSLNIATHSLSSENNAKDNTNLSPLLSPKHQHITLSSVPSPPLVPTPQPRKKSSFLGHGSRTPLAKPPLINPNPGSAPPIVFPALQVRPVSTMFSSMPSDYISGAASPPPVPMLSFRPTVDSPSTPGFSSRSASFSTGSSDAGPLTPSVDHSASAVVLSQLRDQVNGAREVWKSQIADLEAQVRALKKDVEELRMAPCAACGHVGCEVILGGEVKTSMLNRPRAKTAATGGRTLFGGDD